MTTNILASIGRTLWRYLEANDIDAESLFKSVGLDPSLVHEPRTRYPYNLLCDAYLQAAIITGDNNIGFEATQYCSPFDLNALGVSFLSSSTLTEAFQRLIRYESAMNSDVRFTLHESNDRIELESAMPDVPEQAIHIVEDARASILVELCRSGLDRAVNPLEISFTYPEPDNTEDHLKLFKCPLKFSQPSTRITFSLADAQRPFTSANRELAVSGDQVLEGIIRELKKTGIINQARRAIIENLPSGTPSEEEIAKQVFMSSRTLQRKLAEEKTSYRKLLLEVRRDLAKLYIADKTIPLVEISYMLGFSDTSSFSRAFKQWMGESPSNFRNNPSV